MRVMFLLTSMPVGGAETLLVNLVRRMDRTRFAPELCLLKELGPLGELMASEMPVHTGLLRSKWDLRILPRLVRLFRKRGVDAIVTVGAGDKMFWGRIAARLAGVPVIASALHSTGWPDGLGRLNRMLTPITDAFIAVADSHGKFLVEQEGLPAKKVVVIPNGVDTDRFAPLPDDGGLRRELGLSPTTPILGIVAALRPEKNHAMFLEVANRVHKRLPEARFVIVGDGPEREPLERVAHRLKIRDYVHFLGSRDDVPRIVAGIDVFALTSHIEANPVSILEAMSAGKPVVATDVGSVRESVANGKTGFLVTAGDADAFAERAAYLLESPLLARKFGENGRQHVLQFGSLETMVRGYEELLEREYWAKTQSKQLPSRQLSRESIMEVKAHRTADERVLDTASLPL
jgi:glycosyltransferase involved in cell wall biosynthesis